MTPEVTPTARNGALQSEPALSNRDFLHALLPGIDFVTETFWAAMFPGDPNTDQAQWRGIPVTEREGYLERPSANSFFAISTIRRRPGAGRRKNHFGRLFVVPLDDVEGELPLPPTYVIQTSPHKRQAAYRLAEPITDPSLADRLMQAMVRSGRVEQVDRGGCNIARYVRLPLGCNTKASHVAANGGKPFSHQLLEWHPERAYSVDEIAQAFGLDLTPPPPLPKVEPRPGGDRRHALLLGLLHVHGLYKRDLGDGRYEVRCPWVEEHTGAVDSGTCYFAPSEKEPEGGFKCQHGHCAERHLGELRRKLGPDIHWGPEESERPTQDVALPREREPGEDDDLEESAPSLKTLIADSRPVIVIDHDLARMGDELDAALLLANLGLYQRCSAIVRIRTDAAAPRGLRRAPGTPTIAPAGRGHLLDSASRAARWVKYDGRNKCEVEKRPDRDAVGTYIERSSWGLPPLTGIVSGPTLRPDGTVLVRPGYDVGTGLFFAADGASYPEIPAAPTKDDAERALAELLGVFVDFPFVADCDRSAAVAALLTVVGRTAITGCVPAFPVTATAPGTGKTLLVDAISLIGTGSPASKIPQSDSDEETKKLMLSIALAGDRVVLWDNLHYPFGGAPIDLAITAGTVRDRVLGASEMRSAPWMATIFATGQNLAYKGDVTRRVIPIRLDAQSEHPERRTGFTYGDLLGWVAAERPRLLVAALTVLRAFIAAGRPRQPVRDLGSFGEWVGLVAAALVWLGQGDPAECQDSIESGDDEDRQQLAALIAAWRAKFGAAARTLAEALAVEHAGSLHDALHALDPRWDGRAAPSVKRIGRALRRYARRVAGGQRLVRAGDDGHGVALWKVEEVRP